jgi:hypothetical protein
MPLAQADRYPRRAPHRCEMRRVSEPVHLASTRTICSAKDLRVVPGICLRSTRPGCELDPFKSPLERSDAGAKRG